MASAPEQQPTNRWRSLLHERLVDKPLPLLVNRDIIVPGASIWLGARLWYKAFRTAGLKKGDRVVLALAPSPAFLQVLVAALWEQLTIAIVPHGVVNKETRQFFDAKVVVNSIPGEHVWCPDGLSGPSQNLPLLAKALLDPTEEARFLLKTSGTSGKPKWVALSDANVLSVLECHIPEMDLEKGRVLSVLPWFHVFGLTLDLLASLLSGAEIIRDEHGGKDTAHLIALHKKWHTTHVNAVPLMISRLAEQDDGMRLLEHLKGGIIGGAAVSAPIASILSSTALRVGYGQTEASPGITLGEPGYWEANYLGSPLGCSIRISKDDELHFQGPNACLGFWRGELVVCKKDRWVGTGDLVEERERGLFYRGRIDDAFKMDNGRFVYAGYWEALLKEVFSHIDDVLLFRTEANTLVLGVKSRRQAGPDLDDLKRALGPLGPYLGRVEHIAPERWLMTPKGSVNRSAMIAELNTHCA